MEERTSQWIINQCVPIQLKTLIHLAHDINVPTKTTLFSKLEISIVIIRYYVFVVFCDTKHSIPSPPPLSLTHKRIEWLKTNSWHELCEKMPLIHVVKSQLLALHEKEAIDNDPKSRERTHAEQCVNGSEITPKSIPCVCFSLRWPNSICYKFWLVDRIGVCIVHIMFHYFKWCTKIFTWDSNFLMISFTGDNALIA